MKNDCSIVQDLLPLYAENMVKPETREFVEEHLAGCESCRNELDALRTGTDAPAPEMQLAPLRGIERALRRRRLTAVLLTAALVLTLATAGFAYVTAPQYMPYGELEWQLTALCKTADGTSWIVSPPNGQKKIEHTSRIVITLTSPVSGARVDATTDENGKTLYFISAWRTPWDEWFGKFSAADPTAVQVTKGDGLGAVAAESDTVQDILYDAELVTAILRSGKEGFAVYPDGTYLLALNTENCAGIYYSPNNGRDDVLLYGERTDGGMISLPRLALGYYALLALALGAALGLAWLVCRKKPCGGTLGRLALVPLCYLAGHLLVKGFTTTSYQMQRDLALIVLAGALVCCAALLALRLWEQRRSAA